MSLTIALSNSNTSVPRGVYVEGLGICRSCAKSCEGSQQEVSKKRAAKNGSFRNAHPATVHSWRPVGRESIFRPSSCGLCAQ
jgi:hypothetical protein